MPHHERRNQGATTVVQAVGGESTSFDSCFDDSFSLIKGAMKYCLDTVSEKGINDDAILEIAALSPEYTFLNQKERRHVYSAWLHKHNPLFADKEKPRNMYQAKNKPQWFPVGERYVSATNSIQKGESKLSKEELERILHKARDHLIQYLYNKLMDLPKDDQERILTKEIPKDIKDKISVKARRIHTDSERHYIKQETREQIVGAPSQHSFHVSNENFDVKREQYDDLMESNEQLLTTAVPEAGKWLAEGDVPGTAISITTLEDADVQQPSQQPSVPASYTTQHAFCLDLQLPDMSCAEQRPTLVVDMDEPSLEHPSLPRLSAEDVQLVLPGGVGSRSVSGDEYSIINPPSTLDGQPIFDGDGGDHMEIDKYQYLGDTSWQPSDTDFECITFDMDTEDPPSLQDANATEYFRQSMM